MKNISDIIEEFLLTALADHDKMSISRNELANYFNCAPSQINYVLSTRFTFDKGFIIESRRGGGGSVTLIRINDSPSELLHKLSAIDISEGVSYQRAQDIVEKLVYDGLLTEREGKILLCVLQSRNLVAPSVDKDVLRASILKGLVGVLGKEEI